MKVMLGGDVGGRGQVGTGECVDDNSECMSICGNVWYLLVQPAKDIPWCSQRKLSASESSPVFTLCHLDR